MEGKAEQDWNFKDFEKAILNECQWAASFDRSAAELTIKDWIQRNSDTCKEMFDSTCSKMIDDLLKQYKSKNGSRTKVGCFIDLQTEASGDNWWKICHNLIIAQLIYVLRNGDETSKKVKYYLRNAGDLVFMKLISTLISIF